MMPIKTIKYLACLPLLILMQYCNQPQDQIDKEEYYTMEDFPKVVKYDTHIHINTPDPFFVKFAIRNHFRLLSLNVGPSDYPPIEQQQEFAVKYLKEFPGDFAYATTFHIEGFGDSDWQQKTLDYLKTSFGKGAIGVKVWKNIGMEFKDREGKFVMIDNPRFDTIFNFIEHNNKTVVGHLGEPKNCWLPLEKMTVKNDQEYYKRHPEYHMFLHPEFPSYEDQINARDNMLKKHPDLRFDGAHLGSLEFSKQLLAHAKVAVSPGLGFGEYGEGFVRIALVENEHRIRQAARNVKKFLSLRSNEPVLEQDRQKFEGTLNSFYSTRNATAERLAKFVAAVSAAVYCELTSVNATAALLEFPVDPSQPRRPRQAVRRREGLGPGGEILQVGGHPRPVALSGVGCGPVAPRRGHRPPRGSR